MNIIDLISAILFSSIHLHICPPSPPPPNFTQKLFYFFIFLFFIYIFSFFTVVDIGMIDFFTEHGYKFILALGLLVAENPDVKTVCADRDSILTVLECLKQQRLSPSLSKWCIWSLMVRLILTTILRVPSEILLHLYVYFILFFQECYL